MYNVRSVVHRHISCFFAVQTEDTNDRKTEQLISPYEDIEKQLTNPTRKRAYRLTQELQNNKLSKIMDAPISVVIERFIGAKRASLSHATIFYYR